VDPKVLQTLQAYLYAGDDPVNGGDPSGLAPSCQWWNIVCQAAAVGDSIYQGFTDVLSGKSIQNACSNVGLVIQPTCDLGALGAGILEVAGAAEGSDSELGDVSIGIEARGMPLGEEIGILHDAATGRGNFGLGRVTAEEAEILGRDWVGEHARVLEDGKVLMSEDGLHQYRVPTYKPKLGEVQANLESRNRPSGQWVNNGHLTISQP
jgi:hypothetical protein